MIVFSQDTIQSDVKVNKAINALLQSTGKYLNTSENDKSLVSAKKALALSLEHNKVNSAAVAYNLIGLNFANVNEIENALKYYDKGIIYATKAKNDTILSWIYNNLGNLYSYNKKETEKGIEYYLKAIEYSKKVDQIEYSYNALNLANTYIEIKEFEKAKNLLNEVKPFVTGLLSKEYEAKFFYYSLTGSYYEWRKFNYLAEENYLKALDICLERPSNFPLSNEAEIYKTISKFYYKTRIFDKAYVYLIKSDSINKKLFDAEKDDNVKILGQQIEKEEVKRELLKVEAEKKIQDQKLINIKVLSVLVLIIFLATLLLLYYQYKLNKIRQITNSELKNANEELLIAKEKAEEASKIKSQFVSTISHELRTPLYGVIGITDIIEAEHKELENSQHLKALKFSANYLLSLVNDTLKVYKFEENMVTLENNLFNIEDKLETIKDSLQVIAKKYHNSIIIDVDSNIPQFVIGDSIRLSQIIINLMSNSLKFTNNGTVTVSAKLDRIEDNLVYISFDIADDGIGIPKEYQEKVFEKFVQIDRREDDYQGTGLGLTIVQKLVTLFKGTISLKSEENEGTTITFTIPLESGENKVNEFVNNIDVDLSVATILKILIVEDNKINQIVTKKLLENHKFICDVADDGFIALEMLDSNKYDAILMDINMPKINGFETTKLIREKGIFIPVIAVTAFEKEEVQAPALASGIDDVISKPFDARKLFQMIRKFTRS